MSLSTIDSSGAIAARPLESIARAASRAEGIAEMLQGFLARYHGGGQVQGNEASAPFPTGHGPCLERLTANLDHLAKLADEICALG